MFRHGQYRATNRDGRFSFLYALMLLPLVLCIFCFRGLLILTSTTMEPAPLNEDTPKATVTHQEKHFQLRHILHHGTGKYHRVHRRLDITPLFLRRRIHTESIQVTTPPDPDNLLDIYTRMDWPDSKSGMDPWTVLLPLRKSPKPVKVSRLAERHTPNFLDSYLQYAISVKGNKKKLDRINLEWKDENTSVPDVSDKDSLVSLALMCSNAYVKVPDTEKDKNKLDWIDVGDPWDVDRENLDVNFGWLEDGLRGHVFVSNDTKTVVIAIKGTSGAGVVGGGPEETTQNDKINDNLLFSCCCARVSYLWTTVCDCYEKAYTCKQDCLESELLRQDRYYQAALDIYRNVTLLYPPETTDIWVTGHSLGGALASLLGRTYGIPAVALEAPGEMLATKRLHLPKPPGLPPHLEHIWHIGNTADPIFMGVCNGVSSACSLAGYAMESTCHTGMLCIYDVVNDLGWHVNLLNHRIHRVIDNIIQVYNVTPTCVPLPPCRDCFNWRYTSRDDEPADPKKPEPIKHSTFKTLLLTILPAPSETTTSMKKTSPSSIETGHPKKCLERTWYGWCLKWNHDDDDEKSSE